MNESLSKEERHAESRRRLADLGEVPARKKRKYLQNDARIERIVGRYDEYKEVQEDALDGDWQEGLLKYLLTLGRSARGVFLQSLISRTRTVINKVTFCKKNNDLESLVCLIAKFEILTD